MFSLVNTLVILSFIGALASAIIYAPRPWYKTIFGRHSMAWMTTTLLVVSLALVRSLWGDQPWFETARTVTYAVLTVLIYWQLWLLIVTGRSDDVPEPERGKDDVPE